MKKLQETFFLKADTLTDKLRKQDFHYNLEEDFKPIIENQKQNQIHYQQQADKQIQALRDSSQNTTKAIENQTRSIENLTKAIRNRSDILSKNLQKSFKEGIQEFDESSNRKIQLLQGLRNSNQIDSSIVKTVATILSDKNKSHFSSEPVESNANAVPNLFTINPTSPQQHNLPNPLILNKY